MTILITGAAGFIGFHLSKKLLAEGESVIGIDNINDYYDSQIKKDRLHNIDSPNFHFIEGCITDLNLLEEIFINYHIDKVVNLAGQAGVRYSISNPGEYINSNLVGFGNILEMCRKHGVIHLVYASSSSVYGLNSKMPFSERDAVNHPVSLYAATKKANELMAHSYSHLYGFSTTGLRFFTVYGPWGRPDMAYFDFTKSIIEGKTISVFNNGNMMRGFTYIDDIVEGLVRTIALPNLPDPNWSDNEPSADSSCAPYRIFNVGNSNPIKLLDFIEAIEEATGIKAIKEFHPMQPADVVATFSDTSSLEDFIGYKPATHLNLGIEKFVKWYREYYDQ